MSDGVPKIAVSGLRKAFGQKTVLDGVDPSPMEPIERLKAALAGHAG